jgi:hypothetical protein
MDENIKKLVRKTVKKMLKKKNRTDLVMPILAMAAAIVPLVPGIINKVKSSKKEGPGFIDEFGDVITALEIDGARVEGEEILQVAREGLAARAKRAREQSEQDLDRRVARAVEKALQGKQGFKDVKVGNTSQQYGEV